VTSRNEGQHISWPVSVCNTSKIDCEYSLQNYFGPAFEESYRINQRNVSEALPEQFWRHQSIIK
jgi:hypothetical protein